MGYRPPPTVNLDRMRTRLVSLAVAGLLLSACGNLLDPAAAVVNGHKITVDQVKLELDRFKSTQRFQQLAAEGDEGALEHDIEQSYLSLLIRLQVLKDAAAERDIEVTEADVTKKVEEIKAEDFSSEGDFQEALKEEGLDLEQLRLRVEGTLLEDAIKPEVTADVAPSESELRAYYEDHLEDYQEVRAQHILVGSASLAAKLSDQLKSTPEAEIDDTFAKLAKKYSEDPSSAERGGDLGWSRPGGYVEEFAAAISTLEIGQISDPVKTEFGNHVIRVTGRRVEPFEQVRADIEQEISGEKADEVWRDWLLAEYEDADVRVNSRYGKFDYDSLLVADPGAEDVPGAAVPTPVESPPAP
jgi:foldase protein PrsA